MEILTETIKCRFTDAELIAVAREQARLMDDRVQAEEELENFKAGHKARTTRIDTEVTDCTRKIQSGYEMRPIRCMALKFRPDGDSCVVVRLDNGRMLRRRKLSPDEKQIKLSDKAPDQWAFSFDLYEDTDEGVAAICVAEAIPLTEAEMKTLKEGAGDTVKIKSLRKMIQGKA